MTAVFGENSYNRDVFETVLKSDINTNLLLGFNCTCFVYGMTGAGKTYTMFGDNTNTDKSKDVRGLVELSLKEILSAIQN